MNAKKIIEALNITYDWIDYASDYFKEKHGWDDDEKAIKEAINEVEALRSASCQTCKWLQDEVCTNTDSPMVADYPNTDMMCMGWEGKIVNTKLDRVLEYLKKHREGSRLQIFNATKYWNVGDAILRLRRRGHNIITTWETSQTGSRYAVYIYTGRANEKEA